MAGDAKVQAERMRDSVMGCPFPRVTIEMNAGADPSEWPEDLRVREFPR